SFTIAMAAAPAGLADRPIPARRLGRINFQAGMLGIGAQYLGDFELEQSHVNRVVAEAIDNGVNYFDTAPPYNLSEERLGYALKGKRDKVFLVSKVETNAKSDVFYQLRDSLRKLQTGYLDCCHIHNISRDDRYPKLEQALAMDGTLCALLEAKKQGMIRPIGVTSHLRPARVLPALETGEVELFMCTINHVERHIYGYEEKVLPECRKRNIGVIAMKVLGGPLRNSLARLTTPQEYADTLRYTWGVQGVCVAIIGIRTQDQLKQALVSARSYRQLTPEEMKGVTERGKQLAANWGPLRGPVA
ncbi:MAG: aldo/keto reductase, partial [Acidobacteria bacterium]|nr:aldo/keto reductase [Acidobacteriota bacterium]